jgi:hypothetical protein
VRPPFISSDEGRARRLLRAGVKISGVIDIIPGKNCIE